MRKSFILLLFSLLVIRMSAQRYDIQLNGCYFNSIFSKVGSGNFKGTINGVLFMKNYQGGDVILDFQGGKANLNIEEDKDEIYDVSWKKYQGYTTS